MKSSSPIAVYAAIAGNLAIAVTKFIAAIFTGSAAMLAEGFHSVVDTGNGLLLLLGVHRSKRPPDENHPFGHGKDLYFWSLMVALVIFALGGGLSVYEGVQHLLHPKAVEEPVWNYGVLAMSFVFEATTFSIAYWQFHKGKHPKNLWRAVRASKDPTTFTVLFEDSAALVGLVIAFLGIFLGEWLENPYLDGVASLLIGLLLGVVAMLLARESRGLLLGEGVNHDEAETIRDMARQDPAVESAAWPMTMYLGPNEVLLNLDIKFRPATSANEVEGAVDRLETAIRDRFPQIRRIYIEAEALTDSSHDGQTG